MGSKTPGERDSLGAAEVSEQGWGQHEAWPCIYRSLRVGTSLSLHPMCLLALP